MTFTRVATVLDETTGLVTPTTTTVGGFAVRIPGDAARYARGGWTLSLNPTLLTATTTFGDVPAPGDTVTWGTTVYTVKDVEPLEPDGSAIISTVVVGL